VSFVHGKSAVFKIGSTDLSAYTNSIEVKRAADSHDITAYGATGHAYQGGLTDGTLSVSGIYDDGDTSYPRQLLGDALGTSVAWVFRAEGTGSTNPEVDGNGIVTSYEESAPVADMITWAAEIQITGAVNTGDQS
jgi:hypothetical protein